LPRSRSSSTAAAKGSERHPIIDDELSPLPFPGLGVESRRPCRVSAARPPARRLPVLHGRSTALQARPFQSRQPGAGAGSLSLSGRV
jgi:hypothetical protein